LRAIADPPLADGAQQAGGPRLAPLAAIDLQPQGAIEVPAGAARFHQVEVAIHQRGHARLDLGLGAAPIVIEVFILGDVDRPRAFARHVDLL